MNKKITLDVFRWNTRDAIRAIENYQKWIEDKVGEFVNRLADVGLQVASASFQAASYDGTNDVSVNLENRGENTVAVVAIGASTLFIEFGTGITYPDNHPEKPPGVLGRGEYGAGHGKQRVWGYYGDPGTNGLVKEKKNGAFVVLTHGNPPAMAMYGARKEIETEIERIAREVFGS